MNNVTQLSVQMYGPLQAYNEVLSKARCRIFYKGKNANDTYITDDFAAELISSLPYTPVKGIYEDGDFSDHGFKNSEGQIYGIVPENPNFAWEPHLDDDGIEREYACTDVLLFTALYAEANEILGKSQSMELYAPSLEYHVEIIDGQKYIVFEHGRFFGLQVLGDDVQPCFEGASFFTLRDSIQDTIEKIREFTKLEDCSCMENLNFAVENTETYNAIWQVSNPNYTVENNWVVDESILEVADDYALIYSHKDNEYYKVFYTKNEETEAIEITNTEKVYAKILNESENEVANTLYALNGETYESVSETLANAKETLTNCESLQNSNAEFTAKIEELTSTISTLQTEIENFKAQVESANASIEEYTKTISEKDTKIEELSQYKHSIETQQKEAIISEYQGKIDESTLSEYTEKIDDYSVVELDKELAYALKKSNPSVFDKAPSGIVLKDVTKTGVEEILSRY